MRPPTPPDEKAGTAVAFLDRPAVRLDRRGITTFERIVSDNGVLGNPGQGAGSFASN